MIPKPSAPSEIRGEFGTIATNVPGLQICELMPRQAQMADKLTILRNMGLDDGDAHQLHVPLTGFYSRQERPAFGSDRQPCAKRPCQPAAAVRQHGRRTSIRTIAATKSRATRERLTGRSLPAGWAARFVRACDVERLAAARIWKTSGWLVE